MLSADKHSQISQISQLQMAENFSGATEISDAVWKIEVSEWNSSVFGQICDLSYYLAPGVYVWSDIIISI